MTTTTRKVTIPTEVAEILALREAGYSLIAIANKVNKSPRTVSRIVHEHGAIKGGLKREILERAKSELLALVSDQDTIKKQIAIHISDNLAHSAHIRSVAYQASEKLVANTREDAVTIIKACAAYSSMIRNTSEVLGASLALDKEASSEKDLSELVIREISASEASAMGQAIVDEMKNQDDGTYTDAD